MQIHRLKLVNFRQHADTEFELGLGLTAVVGPNGAGKTTLQEAIAWAIFGNQAARGDKDSIPRIGAPARSPVRVELDFTLGSHDFRVSRGLRDAQLYLDNGSEPVSSGTAEVTAVLARWLGMSRKEFFSTYFTGQKELAVMASHGPAERGRFLSQILGYERLKDAQEAARSIRNQRKSELAGLESGLGDQSVLERNHRQAQDLRVLAIKAMETASATKETAVQAVAMAKPARERAEDVKQKMLMLDGDRRAAEHQVVDARREHERLDKELAYALMARSKVEELAPKLLDAAPLRAELERLDQEGRAAGQRRDLSGELREVEAQAAKAKQRLEEVGDAAAALKERESELRAANANASRIEAVEDKARTAWVQDKERAQSKRDELADLYKDIKEQRDKVVELGPKGLCPTCGREMGKDFEALVGQFNRQMEELVVNGQYYKSRIAQLESEPKELQEVVAARTAAAKVLQSANQAVADARAEARERGEVEKAQKALETRVQDLRKKIAELPEKYDAERHDQVRDRLKELEPLIRQRDQYAFEARRAAALVTDMEVAEKRLSEREARVKQLASAIADLGFSEEGYREARAAHERAELALQAANDDVSGRRGDLRVAEQALEMAAQLLEQRAQRATKIDELRVDLLLHDELDSALGEIRTDLNAQMRPELSDIASSLLSELTDERYTQLELDESYGIILIEDGSVKPVLSAGEEDVANLALRLAISRLVADRAGQSISLLVLDDIFGSLDETRRDSVVHVLSSLGDLFPQVIFLTHVESVISSARARLNRVLRVSVDQEKGGSVVTEDIGLLSGGQSLEEARSSVRA